MPKSCLEPSPATPGYVVFTGVAGAVAAAVCIAFGWVDPLGGALFLLFASAAPMWWLEMRRLPAPALAPGPVAVWRKQLRLTGLVVVFALFGAVNALMNQALAALGQSGLLSDMLLALLALAAPWALWMLGRKARGNRLDSVELLGSAAVLLLRKGRKPQRRHRQALLGWGVKAHFLPMMLGSCYAFVWAAGAPLATGRGTWVSTLALTMFLLFAVDTAFATIGYCSTSRRVGAHIRSTDPTVFGWAVTLACYPPFNFIVLHQWLAYKDGYEWHDWMAGHPWLLAVWGSLILLLTAGYVWSTVSFGLRFSNLSYRGLVSSGPYRYFKHPSYVFKNLSWWLIFIPFVSQQGAAAAAANCLGLLGINGIYALRAWTEERHLASKPDYQAYSAWMAECGVFARLCRLARSRRFVAP